MADLGFPSRVHPCQWHNGLIPVRYVAISSGALLSCAVVAGGLGWHLSGILVRPVPTVDAEALWTTGSIPTMPFDQVTFPGPLGDYPAWLVPHQRGGDTWIIAVHGRGADRREALRIVPTLHRLGLPVLAISYREDKGAPSSPDRNYHLGDSEWADLAASVRYARACGARRVVLFGWSMGAAIIGAFLDRAEEGRHVAGVIWDSPVLDWRATLRRQAAEFRVPAWLTSVVTRCTTARIGIDFDRFDLVRRPPGRRPPTLLIQGGADDAVPPEPGRALVEAADRLDWPLRYLEVPAAAHTAAWNTDPAAYESAVAQFLTEIVSG